MFYRLAKRLRLRGWQHLTTVLVDSLGRRVRILSKQEFAVLVLCDGETEMESVLNNPESKEIIRDFEEKKYIIPSEVPAPVAEVQKYKYFENRYFESILWSITGKCNFRCRHCYMDAPHSGLGELSTEEMLDIIDQIAECGIQHIDLTGGEPLVRKDFWQIVDHMKARRLFVGKIYTNGWLFDESVIEQFKERRMKPAVSISFDGLGWHDWMRGINGAEEKAVRALKLAHGAGMMTDVELCLHKGNINTVRETVKYLASIGVSDIKIGKVMDTPLWMRNSEGYSLSNKEFYEAALEYIPQYYEDGRPMRVLWGGAIDMYPHSLQYRVVAEKASSEEQSRSQFLCGAARFHAYITPDGRFLPCMSITSLEAQNKFPLIRDNGVKQCMGDGYYMGFIGNRVGNLFEQGKKCSSCEYRFRCCGGCRANAMFANNGELYAHDPETCFLFENGYVDRIKETAEKAVEKFCK